MDIPANENDQEGGFRAIGPMALAAIGGGGLANWALRNRAADL